MPMDRKRYPPDWKRIATEIKEAADWKCQNCGKQCRRPGEPFDTHQRTLTVAHLNHTPEDVRPGNLQALCAPCHLRYDAQHHAETRRKKAMQSQEDKYIRLADAVDAMGKAQWAKDRLRDIEPADVVQVTRCGDCEHWRDGMMGMGCHWDANYPPQKNDFCSYGERKEEHGNSNGDQHARGNVRPDV